MNDTPSPEPRIVRAQSGAVAILRFASPPEGCITVKGAALLADAVEAALSDAAVRAIVLTGERPGIFIRHADVGQIARAADAVAGGQADPAAFAATPFRRLGRLLDEADKPVIAAIDGVCMGGGLEIALACAMRVAAPWAGPIGLPEIRLDIFPGSGGTQRLARVIGRQRARILMLTGDTMDGAAAHAIGIVDALAADPLAHAIGLAEGFARRAPGAIAAILRHTRDEGEAARIDAEMTGFGAHIGADPEVRARLHRFARAGERLDQIE